MGQQLTVAQERKQQATVFRTKLEAMAPELEAALPEHVNVQKFMRTVMTAVNGDQNLLSADRRSLFESAVKAAQDGLLPDKREGALVIYAGKVQWMPMIAGILKKMRNSGELLTVTAQVAYEHDAFDVVYGDDERIEHKPFLGGERGKPVAVYAIGKTKAGGIYREVMTIPEVEKVRAVSRAAKNGPWVTWWDEMARKTVLRRLAKRMPQSTDIERVLARDDEMYDFGRRAASAEGAGGRLFSRADNPLSDDEPEIPHDRETGEVSTTSDAQDAEIIRDEGGHPVDPEGAGSTGDRSAPGFGETGGAAGKAAGGTPKGAPAATSSTTDPKSEPDPIAKAREHGADTARRGNGRRPPGQIKEPGREAELKAWNEAYDAVLAEGDAR